MLAMREVGLKYKVPIPVAGDFSRLSPDLAPYARVSQAIHKWYQEHYADRLKVDPCPGRTVVRLDGDLYTLRVPLIFGTVRFVMSQRFLPPPRLGPGPSECNMLQLVEDLTEAKALRLSDAALQEVNDATLRAIHAIWTLASTPHELMRIARGDVAVAVSNLMERQGRFGESKWASLQAAEKVLKAAIALAGGSFGKVHELEKLFAQLEFVGIRVDPKPYVDAIQCKPGIRYGEEACTLEEALDAHRRSLDLVNALRDAGAKFNLGLGGLT
jgi:HEPN domain-containing protein